MVKSLVPNTSGHGWRWQLNRYDVLNKEKVDGRDCFVLQEKYGDTTSAREGGRFLYYARTDDYRIVRQVEYFWQAGNLIVPRTLDFPDGVFTDMGGVGQQLPQFPLDTVTPQDSMFRLRGSGQGQAYVRQFVGPADSAQLGDYLNDPEPSAGLPVHPRGSTMFSVLSEMGAPREPGGPDVPWTYTLQLWSANYPWRLYREWGQYKPPGSSTRRSSSRSWLIAVGHKKK